MLTMHCKFQINTHPAAAGHFNKMLFIIRDFFEKHSFYSDHPLHHSLTSLPNTSRSTDVGWNSPIHRMQQFALRGSPPTGNARGTLLHPLHAIFAGK
jgi:hypothetical protein